MFISQILPKEPKFEVDIIETGDSSPAPSLKASPSETSKELTVALPKSSNTIRQLIPSLQTHFVLAKNIPPKKFNLKLSRSDQPNSFSLAKPTNGTVIPLPAKTIGLTNQLQTHINDRVTNNNKPVIVQHVSLLKDLKIPANPKIFTKIQNGNILPFSNSNINVCIY